MYQGLLDPAILARKTAEEKALRDKLPPAEDAAWEAVARAEKTFADFERKYYLFERGDA